MKESCMEVVRKKRIRFKRIKTFGEERCDKGIQK